MKYITVVATLLVIMLAGCAVNSGIVAKGSDTFFVSRQAATGFTGLSGLKPEALEEANRFCAGQGRQFVEINSSSTQPPYVLGNFPRVEIEFKCLTGGLEEHEACFANLASDPELNVIKNKVALSGVSDQTFSMLSDNAKPTTTEKSALQIWGGKRDVCMKKHVAYERAKGTPLEVINLFESADTSGQVQIAELLNGQITYSSYAIKRRELSTLTTDTFVKIKAELRKETAESRFKASQLAIEAQKNTLLQEKISSDREMQEKQIRQQNVTPPSAQRNTNCNVNGNQINCSSY